jgi:hypothetical protein
MHYREMYAVQNAQAFIESSGVINLHQFHYRSLLRGKLIICNADLIGPR